MSIKLTGNFAALQRLAQKLANPKPALASASRNMADEGLNLINEGFAAEKDPSGKGWAKLKSRTGKILQKTGGMAASWHRQSSSSGFRLWAGKKYSKYHQDGTEGHKESTRFQPVAGEGFSPFISKKKAGKQKRGAVTVRELNFKEGEGKIPARKMVPDPGPLPRKWRARLEAAAREAIMHHFRT